MCGRFSQQPVVIPDEAWELWLDPELEDVGELRGLLEPSDELDLRIWAVNPLVNNVRNDGFELMAPLAPAAATEGPSPGLFDSGQARRASVGDGCPAPCAGCLGECRAGLGAPVEPDGVGRDHGRERALRVGRRPLEDRGIVG